jgi:hypothetical protein
VCLQLDTAFTDHFSEKEETVSKVLRVQRAFLPVLNGWVSLLNLPLHQKNFNEEKGFITFTKEELDGVPDDVVSGYTKHESEDLYDVTFKTPDLIPLVNNPNEKHYSIGIYNRASIG